MLLADAPPETLLQVAAMVALALVSAYSTIRLRQIDQRAKRHRRLGRAERDRCDSLEVRVGELEKALGACLRRHKPAHSKPRRKG